MRTTTDLLPAAYAPLLALSDRLADGTGADPDVVGWTATALPGWTVRDLLFHLASDAQRALVALHTPTDDEVATDEVSYWSGWQPGSDGAQTGLRGTRTIASQWSSVRGPAGLHRETARAVLHAATTADPDAVVRTQGHVLTVRSLLSTLVVEAAVHHLDLGTVLPDPPAPTVLAEVRRVCEGLLGAPVPGDWDDVRWVRLATGRAVPTDRESAALGDGVRRLPLFG